MIKKVPIVRWDQSPTEASPLRQKDRIPEATKSQAKTLSEEILDLAANGPVTVEVEAQSGAGRTLTSNKRTKDRSAEFRTEIWYKPEAVTNQCI